MKFSSVVTLFSFVAASPGAVVLAAGNKSGRGFRGLSDGTSCTSQTAYNTEVDNVLSFPDGDIIEKFCNDFDRQKTIDFVQSLDASTLDECEMRVLGPIIEQKQLILTLLMHEDTCKAELEAELNALHNDDENSSRRRPQENRQLSGRKPVDLLSAMAAGKGEW